MKPIETKRRIYKRYIWPTAYYERRYAKQRARQEAERPIVYTVKDRFEAEMAEIQEGIQARMRATWDRLIETSTL